jgi:hypothetical protein
LELKAAPNVDDSLQPANKTKNQTVYRREAKPKLHDDEVLGWLRKKLVLFSRKVSAVYF